MDRYVALLGVMVLVVTVEQAMGLLRHDPLGCHNGTKITVDECCAIPALADKTIVEKCKSEHSFKPPKKDAKERGPHPGACIAECILKGMGAFKDKQIDGAGFRKAIQPVVKANANFAKSIEDAVKACEQRTNMDTDFSVSTDSATCSPVGKLFVNCVYGTLFEQCPTSVWQKKDECTLLKDKIKKGCPYFAMRKHRRMRPT
ncbi:general odorant-binding protein 67-like [Anopheles marshallii]|uniref:general odorant-binding protein 67-like n=1 Tax=Anopheles marshallii TaxID=1521116 RepID=UPI00237A7538|nr:general odorant-binding protein 67-like [Anopheles marshallii]